MTGNWPPDTRDDAWHNFGMRTFPARTKLALLDSWGRRHRMHRAVCPGFFDPVTNAHLDLIGRVAALYDEVIAAVLVSSTRPSLFTIDERAQMLSEATYPHGNVQVARKIGTRGPRLRTEAVNRGMTRAPAIGSGGEDGAIRS